MHHVALLAVLAAMAPPPPSDSTPNKTPVAQCLGSMDGAVYHGDPTDQALMKSNVAACDAGLAAIERIHARSVEGPEKLFVVARILDRGATLSFIGLNDAANAYRKVRLANLYFRVASGLPDASADYHTAAIANVELTALQLHTLRTELALVERPHAAAVVALRAQRAKHGSP